MLEQVISIFVNKRASLCQLPTCNRTFSRPWRWRHGPVFQRHPDQQRRRRCSIRTSAVCHWWPGFSSIIVRHDAWSSFHAPVEQT